MGPVSTTDVRALVEAAGRAARKASAALASADAASVATALAAMAGRVRDAAPAVLEGDAAHGGDQEGRAPQAIVDPVRLDEPPLHALPPPIAPGAAAPGP